MTVIDQGSSSCEDTNISVSYVTDSADYVSSTVNTSHLMSQKRKLDDLLHCLNQKPSSFEESLNEFERNQRLQSEGHTEPIEPVGHQSTYEVINEDNQNVKNSCCCLY